MQQKQQNKKADRNINISRSEAEKDKLYKEFIAERDRIYQKEGFYAAAEYSRDYIKKYAALSNEEMQVFLDVYEYMEKYSKLGRSTSLKSLETWLKDVKGYENARSFNIFVIAILIMSCGFDMLS